MFVIYMQLPIDIREDKTSEVCLDTRELIINSVTDKKTGQDFPDKFADEHKVYCKCSNAACGLLAGLLVFLHRVSKLSIMRIN